MRHGGPRLFMMIYEIFFLSGSFLHVPKLFPVVAAFVDPSFCICQHVIRVRSIISTSLCSFVCYNPMRVALQEKSLINSRNTISYNHTKYPVANISKMVFHTILALNKLRYDEHPNFNTATGLSNPYPGWINQSGIACGPAGNNCAVEGNGRRGPGPLPLPGNIRAIFHGTGRLHDGDHSLFDLHRARIALNGHSVSQVLPQEKRGFGSGAYNSTPTPMYSLSHTGYIPNSSSSYTSNSFFGGLSSPAHTPDINSMWGKHSRGAQFSSSSMVPQQNNSLFHYGFHNGVVSMASVAVVSGQVTRNAYSWDVNRAVPQLQHNSKTSTPKPYWAPVDVQSTAKGFLAPEPFTQYPAESPAGYSSI
jgi:hypothetical protein